MFVGSTTKWTSNPEKARLFQHCSDAVDFCLKQADPRLVVVLIFEELGAVCIVEPSRVVRSAWKAVASGRQERSETWLSVSGRLRRASGST